MENDDGNNLKEKTVCHRKETCEFCMRNKTISKKNHKNNKYNTNSHIQSLYPKDWK